MEVHVQFNRTFHPPIHALIIKKTLNPIHEDAAGYAHRDRHQVGSLDAQLADLLHAQALPLLAEDFSKLGTFWNVEVDSLP
jgi:hypothetical protein